MKSNYVPGKPLGPIMPIKPFKKRDLIDISMRSSFSWALVLRKLNLPGFPGAPYDHKKSSKSLIINKIFLSVII
jgi:hypothetical protein